MSRVCDGSFGPVADRLIAVLKKANGAYMPTQDVLDAIYAGAGGRAPDNEATVLRTTLCRLRKRGVPIECVTAFRMIPR